MKQKQRPAVIQIWAIAGTRKDNRKHMANAMRLIPVNKQKQKKTVTGRFAWLHDQLRWNSAFFFFLFPFFIDAQSNGIWFAVNNPRPIIDDRIKVVEGKEARKQTENQVGEIM